MKRYAILRPRIAAAQAMAGARSYVRQGSLEVRLARSFQEIKAAQKLRYKIFYEEMAAMPDIKMKLTRRDIDIYDPICDHLLVIDHDKPRKKQIVGTYRLLRQEVAERNSGFYSAGEYDLSPLLCGDFKDRIGDGKQLLELGRSCVHADYRANSTINMLWKGIAEYLKEHNIAYMFGCASFPGVDPEEFKEAFAYLYHNHVVPDDFRVKALDHLHVPMNTMAAEEVDVRRARRALPPLVKGYLRIGCFIGDGAVVDAQFGTTDVFVLLPVEKIAKRYSRHYDVGVEANDQAATASNASQ
ncbi:ornithine-acyl ACP N-acyltransferase [Kordiimonas sediminis]|uniref:L-ornithine N(alpha)-acyltransferase n=1 Tax=Kordiimonas sediminis TaxID=1735581 RepID=A0A919E567_9PROT|nr:GNAT family N-acyltransferase [Kordiimonas sediminis]GHF14928.1 ornithine-acyl ACP N-acyltransferase [Kordiimonas sediminis]